MIPEPIPVVQKVFEPKPSVSVIQKIPEQRAPTTVIQKNPFIEKDLFSLPDNSESKIRTRSIREPEGIFSLTAFENEGGMAFDKPKDLLFRKVPISKSPLGKISRRLKLF